MLSTEPADLGIDFKHDRPACWTMLARMALRKRKLPLEHAEKLSYALAQIDPDIEKIPKLGLTKDDVKIALDSGKEVRSAHVYMF